MLQVQVRIRMTCKELVFVCDVTAVVVVVVVQVEHPSGRTLTLDWERVRVFDREVAQMFLNLVKNQKNAKLVVKAAFNYVFHNNS